MVFINMLIKTHCLISGSVTGVSYRYYAVRAARQFGISGWIKNRPDEKVEVVIVGEKSATKKMLQRLWKGSPASQVKEVKIMAEKSIATDEFRGRFTVR